MKMATALAIFSLSCFCMTTARAAQVTFDWATIGNPGNAGDVQPQGTFGSVAYTYRISKTEVTNAQYTKFLNAVDPTAANSLDLFASNMAGDFGGIRNTGATDGSRYLLKAGFENQPVTFISWYDSVRFTNWLHNGQGLLGTPSGDTETGVYTLLGGGATPSNGTSVTRNANATYWLPSEDEWYKAAYYDPNKPGGAGYYDYATGSDTIPVSDQPGDDPAAANYFNNDGLANGFNDGYAVSGSTDFERLSVTDVGAYTDAQSPYGTFDQSGNVWEWNEAIIPFGASSLRGVRGGAWNTPKVGMAASIRSSNDPSINFNIYSFRVATIPEQATLAGDFDFDGDVDGADFLQWQRDGLSASDLADWEANFGTAAPLAAASTSVPEPSTGLMMVVCCGVCAMRCRRHAAS